MEPGRNVLSKLYFWLAGVLALSFAVRGGPITPSNFSNNAVTINFDDLAGGNCNLCGPSVTNQYAGLGVTFNNPTFPGQETADTNLTSLVPNASPPNLLFVHQGGMLSDPPAAPFQILFSVPITKVGFDYGSSADSFMELAAYGAGHQLLDTQTFVGTAAPIGLAGFAGVQEVMPIIELDVSYHPNGAPSRTLNFSIDNLKFEGNSTPEPSTAWLALVGLAVTAACQKRHIRTIFAKRLTE
jgi:hypothetical protein